MEIIPKIKALNTSRNKQANTSLTINIELPTSSFNQTITKNPNLVNKIDSKGETLLSYAIRKKKVDKCQIILTSKILDLSYQDKNGNSYLHLAILYKLEKVAQILIEKGINFNKQNKNGKTCLDLALINDLESIINILKSKNKEKKKKEDLKIYKISDLIEPSSRGRNTKANSKKKDKSNNNSKLTAKSTNNNEIKNNVKSMKDSTKDSNKLKINLLFDYGKKTNIKKIESLPTLRDMNKTQKNEKPKNKNLSSIYFMQKIDNGKKSKYKKLVKENLNKKLTEENSISKKNINLDIANNTSEETKFKSGTNKDKKSKTNNNEEQDNNNDDNQLLNFSKDDDIFGFNDNEDFDKQFDKLNNQFKKYPLLNIHHMKDFLEDDKLREAYERINKKYIDEVINSSKNDNNDKNSDENDKEIISQIKEDDEYCVRFEDNKNSDSSEEENNDKNRSSNISDNLLIDTVLKQSNKNNAHQKTRNNNYDEQLKIKSETNRDNYHFNIMNDKQISKTIINKTQNNKIDKLLPKYSDDINNEFENDFENQIAYQLYPDKEEKYKNNLNDLLNNQNCKTERNRIKLSEDIQEPLLLPELDKMPNDIKDIEDAVKNNSLKEFLVQINMQKYLNNFIENGFDDMKMIIEQAQKGIYIKDSELKEAGILIPGDRAKILIRIQEKAGNFKFAVPKSVYYTCKNLNSVNNDINIKNFKNWLKNLRIDNYLKNFINNGYHSIELLFLQMESQSPLTAEILKEEMGIDKIGHRSRIINKLKEDGRSYINKLKTSILLVGNANNNKFCDCILI